MPSVIGVRAEILCQRTNPTSVMGSAAITVEGVVRPSAKVTVLPVPAGLAWLALAVAACRPRVHPSPDQVAVLNLNLELATDTASITVSGCNVSGTCISGRRVYGPVSRIDGRTVYRERICR